MPFVVPIQLFFQGKDGSNAKNVPTSGIEVVSKQNLTLLFTCIFWFQAKQADCWL